MLLCMGTDAGRGWNAFNHAKSETENADDELCSDRHDGCVAATRTRTPHEFFSGNPFALAVFENVRAIVDRLGPIEVRVSKSQVAFRLRRGFAYLWIPGQYLRQPTAEVVLSIALGRLEESPRFKEVAHPAPAEWMHHLEIHQLGDLDDEVANWLREAAERAR